MHAPLALLLEVYKHLLWENQEGVLERWLTQTNQAAIQARLTTGLMLLVKPEKRPRCLVGLGTYLSGLGTWYDKDYHDRTAVA